MCEILYKKKCLHLIKIVSKLLKFADPTLPAIYACVHVLIDLSHGLAINCNLVLYRMYNINILWINHEQ